MAKKLWCTICDRCRTIVGDDYPMRKSKKGDTLHYCSTECLLAHAGKPPKDGFLVSYPDGRRMRVWQDREEGVNGPTEVKDQ